MSNDNPPNFQSKAEAARYIQAKTRELSDLSSAHGLPTLAYMLRLASLEAKGHAQEVSPKIERPIGRER